jgi:DNA-binding transcriptional ArsR family regulator
VEVSSGIASWSFLTNHARVLLLLARDPELRLRDIAARLAITERRTISIVTDLVEAGLVVKIRDGRRNRYEIQNDRPLPEPTGQQRTIGDILEVLASAAPALPERRRVTDWKYLYADSMATAAPGIGKRRRVTDRKHLSGPTSS